MFARLALVVVLVVGADAAVAEPAAGSLIAIGGGPAPSFGGALAARARADGGACRLRMGGWIGRVGVELVMTCAGVAIDRGPRDTLLLSGPAISYHLVQTRWLQLGARAGLVAGAISGTRATPIACERPGPCSEETSVDRAGFAVDVGATAQLTLGARRGDRLLVWADAGVQLGRFQLDDAVVDSRVAAVTFGLGHVHAF